VKDGSVENGAASQLLLASCEENKLAQQWSTRWPR